MASRFEGFLERVFGRKITRNADAVRAATKQIGKGENSQFLALKETFILVPRRYEDIGLLINEEAFSCVGFYCIVSGDHYAVVKLPNMYVFQPSIVKIVNNDGVDWYQLRFDANSVILPTTRTLKDDSIVFKIYNEFLARPNMCQFFSYDDALTAMRTLKARTGAHIDPNGVATEIIVSTITRDPVNPEKLHRYNVLNNVNKEPIYIGFRDVQYGAKNLPSAIMGSYSDIGIDSLIVNPPKKLEKYEYLVRL